MARVARRLLLWTLICGVCAAPSFVIALSLYGGSPQVAAMIVGIVVFILGYTFVTGTTRFGRIRQRPFVRRTLHIGYGTRIFISVVFPIGLYVDLVCGAVSTGIVETLVGGGESFFIILLTTLVQGVVLNVLLFLYMTPIYLFQRIFLPAPAPHGFCGRCSYDLRASTKVCPECGAPVAAAYETAA